MSRLYFEDPVLAQLRHVYWGTPSFSRLPTGTNAIENANLCAAISDRCEELGLLDDAKGWREREESFRSRGNEARSL